MVPYRRPSTIQNVQQIGQRRNTQQAMIKLDYCQNYDTKNGRNTKAFKFAKLTNFRSFGGHSINFSMIKTSPVFPTFVFQYDLQIF